MSYDDLPSDVRTRPLTDPVIAADLVDLVVGEVDRAGGALGLLLCDDDGRLLQPVVITEVDDRCPVDERADVLDGFLGRLADDLGGLVVAIGRDGRPGPDDADRAWHQCLITTCRRHGIRLLGTYLATPGRVEPLPVAEELAA